MDLQIDVIRISEPQQTVQCRLTYNQEDFRILIPLPDYNRARNSGLFTRIVDTPDSANVLNTTPVFIHKFRSE